MTLKKIIADGRFKTQFEVPYIEAQYHGGVSVNYIDTITILGKTPPKLDDELYQLLKANKIKVNWLDEKTQKLREFW